MRSFDVEVATLKEMHDTVEGALQSASRRELVCPICGYRIFLDREPKRCPMCGGEEWEHAPPRPSTSG
jgi:rubrerythrin